MALEDIIAQPPIHPRLMQTLGALQGTNPNFDDLFANLARAVLGARQEADTAGRAFQSELAKGPPQTNPLADALARAAGGAADLFTGRDTGRALATETIRGEQNTLLQKRKESLTALEGAYQRAADRAAKLGDFETEMQFLTKRDSALKNSENLSKMLMANAEFELTRQGRAEEHINRMGLQALENQGRLDLSQKEYSQNVALQRIREQGDQRVAYINQGLDPNDPTKPLIGSKAQSIRNAVAKGFLNTQQWQTHYFDVVNQARSGKPDFKGPKLIQRVLSIAPDHTYADDPDRWLSYLLTLPDPNRPDKPLIPRDANGNPVRAYDETIKKYMARYFPNWNAAVDSINAVGR